MDFVDLARQKCWPNRSCLDESGGVSPPDQFHSITARELTPPGSPTILC